MIAAGMLAFTIYIGQIVVSLVLAGLTVGIVIVSWKPMSQLVRWQEARFDRVLNYQLLMSIRPRTATLLSLLGVAVLGLFGFMLTSSWFGVVLAMVGGLFLPNLLLGVLARRRIRRLEEQLVGGIQTIASGVRAGLNLVQSMQMIARDGPDPMRQEFRHLLREYEYGVPLDEAMLNAANRIGSADYRLLFSALHTHRERGGDLGETLDRIADSIREIQRLENRVQTLTAQGRATARWLGAMPGVVLAILFFLVDPNGVRSLFADTVGNIVIAGIVVLNVLGFLWIRKIVAIDI